jgi:hypothetical protein
MNAKRPLKLAAMKRQVNVPEDVDAPTLPADEPATPREGRDEPPEVDIDDFEPGRLGPIARPVDLDD